MSDEEFIARLTGLTLDRQYIADREAQAEAWRLMANKYQRYFWRMIWICEAVVALWIVSAAVWWVKR